MRLSISSSSKILISEIFKTSEVSLSFFFTKSEIYASSDILTGEYKVSNSV